MEQVKDTVKNLAKEQRVRVIVACTISLWPIMLAGIVWISFLDFYMQVLAGTVTGLGVMIGFHYMMLYRTRSRKSEAAKIQQLAHIDVTALRRMIPADSIPSWAQHGFDKVDWINKELAVIWPYLDKAVADMAVQQLQPILDQYKLGAITSLQVKEVTLGLVSPLVGGFKVTGGAEDECMLEFKVDWRRGRGQKVAITIATPGPDLEVEVKDFKVFGIIRIILKPLINEIPGFGAVVQSLSEPPEVDFHTSFFGGDVKALPGVDMLVDNMISSALEDTLVWPNRIVMPVAPGNYSYLQLQPVGILHVHLLEGKGLKPHDLLAKSNPFVLLYVRPKQDKIKRSSTKSDTINPVWNEAFDLEVEDPQYQKLQIRLLDADPLTVADYLGAADLPIKQFGPCKAYNLWVPLFENLKKPDQNFSSGQVHIAVSYKPFRHTSGEASPPNEILPTVPSTKDDIGEEQKSDLTKGDESQITENATENMAMVFETGPILAAPDLRTEEDIEEVQKSDVIEGDASEIVEKTSGNLDVVIETAAITATPAPNMKEDIEEERKSDVIKGSYTQITEKATGNVDLVTETPAIAATPVANMKGDIEEERKSGVMKDGYPQITEKLDMVTETAAITKTPVLNIEGDVEGEQKSDANRGNDSEASEKATEGHVDMVTEIAAAPATSVPITKGEIEEEQKSHLTEGDEPQITDKKATGNSGMVTEVAAISATPEEFEKKLLEQDMGALHSVALDLNRKFDARIETAAKTAVELLERNGW